ncbi:mediator complex protein-domain-containing protein [Leptodontidium sp. MPI-SDFR-AT-0119]|nr:mediator complex protein-domain-containing protein [Leptodontidium sp. MPI-SDFR-AT-0119]
MSSTSSAVETPAAFQPFTKAQRIQQLNDIDKSITQLLQSAALALKTLSATQDTTEAPVAERKEAFQKASESYLTTLQKVDVILRRNIYGLEEANIIPADKKKRKEAAAGSAMGGKPAPEVEAAGGDVASLGKLDIGWLNSRSGRVGRDMEAELWEKARGFLEGLEAEGKGGGGNGQNRDVDMSF